MPIRNAPNAWIVEQEQQAWVVSDQGEVIAQAALEERLEAYRAQLARLKGRKGDLVALQRRNIESAIRGTERALKEARAA